MKNSITNLSLEELKIAITDIGGESYRAVQIFEYIHKKGFTDFNKFAIIPKSLQQKLKSEFEVNTVITEKIFRSKIDETKKFLFRVPNHLINKSEKILLESVLMFEKDRITLCVSTQAGCNAGCVFCATGMLGLKLNLPAEFIVNQVYEIIRSGYPKPTNLVFMGMGEPFLNYKNTLKALKLLVSEYGLNYSSKKITISTIGIKDTIRKFADDITNANNKDLRRIKLALSLHSTDNGIREELMPLTKTTTLKNIYEDLIYFYRKTGTKITYEYIFFEGLNDNENDIKRLTKLSKMIPCNINVISFHPVKLSEDINNSIRLSRIKEPKNALLNKKIIYFIERLKENGVTVHLRSSNGIDIEAACGQLAAKQITDN